MKAFRLLLVLSVSFCAITIHGEEKPDYLDPELPLEKRVDDLVSRMTLEEKIGQMLDQAEAIERLQVPEYNWWNECLHGVARAGEATVFPQAIGLAATWNTGLMHEIADVISTEARAKHNDYVKKGERDRYKGLTFWSPNINIFRDPRWGRGQETYGEDPYLTGRMGVSFIKGLQGDNPKYFKVIGTPKHYAVHSGPEPERHVFDAVTDIRDFHETYLPAFEACIKEAGAYSVMCAYNRYEGEACCGSSTLLRDILREEWGFDGYIVSDCGAINDIFRNHKIVETAPEAAALAVKSGTDLNCGRAYSALVEAAKQGLITEEEIDVSVKRLFRARFKLGMFDPPEMVPYTQIPITENDSEEHRQLATRVAQESIVLLKNAGSALPLKKDLKKIAVVGPTADSYAMLIGNYHGTPSKFVTPLQGIKNKAGNDTEVVYEPGCNLVEPGPLIHSLTSDVVTFDGQPGLQAQYFSNPDLEGEPFHTAIDPLQNSNWMRMQIPGYRWGMQLSIRWQGKLIAPAGGDFKFTLHSRDGYRLSIDDNVLIDNWTEKNNAPLSGQISLQEGKSYDFKLEYTRGRTWPTLSVQWQFLDIDNFDNAVKLASGSDVVVFCGGITAELEGEEMPVDLDGFKGGDRTHLKLPKVQEDLLKALHATGRPVVFVATSGSALAINWAQQNLPSIVHLWYPGEEGGTALADVLFGDYNPAGRLPVTFYKSVEQLPPFEEYAMKGRTYKYFEGEPLYAFGYGMSYTHFEYSNPKVPAKAKAGENIVVSVEVRNAGKMAGDEVVELYVKDVEASVPVPIRSLQGLKRIHLNPGEKQKVEFTLTPRQLALVTDDGEYVVEPGAFEIALGGAQPGHNPSTTQVVSKKLMVEGNAYRVN